MLLRQSKRGLEFVYRNLKEYDDYRVRSRGKLLGKLGTVLSVFQIQIFCFAPSCNLLVCLSVTDRNNGKWDGMMGTSIRDEWAISDLADLNASIDLTHSSLNV